MVSAIRLARSDRVARSGPMTLIPTGVLIPVDSMSIRVRIGIVQEFVTPGACTISSSPGTRSAPGSSYP